MIDLTFQVFRKESCQGMRVTTDVSAALPALFQGIGANINGPYWHQLEGTMTLPIAVEASKSVKFDIQFSQQNDITPAISESAEEPEQQDPTQVLYEPVFLTGGTGSKIRVRTVSGQLLHS